MWSSSATATHAGEKIIRSSGPTKIAEVAAPGDGRTPVFATGARVCTPQRLARVESDQFIEHIISFESNAGRSPALRRFALAITALFFLLSSNVTAQTYTPGVSYFGRSNYIEYIAGELPVIFSAPHGGALSPAEIPDRTNCVSCGWSFSTVTDSNTEDLARKIRTEFGNRLGLLPHVVICRLDRGKVDANREIVEAAQGDPEAEQAWNEFHNFIGAARTNLTALHGRGFYVDVHGHGHTLQRLELGYLLSSTQLGLSDATLNGSSTYQNQSGVRTLSAFSPLTFAELLRGTNSFGALIASEGYPAVPSPAIPDPDADPYFDGGYNTERYSSVDGGNIDGLQIESNMTGVRDTATNRTAYAQALARVTENYFFHHYGVNLRESLPKSWTIGAGSFATASSWLNGTLPVSTNHLRFAGAGGNITHNLSALTTGTGIIGSLIFSNAPTGSYTISGNAMSILRGVTNNSAVTQTINNHVTLASPLTFVANSGLIVLGGNITNAGNPLRCIGNITANGIITGNGALTKSGAGTLVLTAINTYSGPTTNSSGSISLNATSTFGNGAGLLVLSGGDLLAVNTRSAAPISNPILLAGSATISGDSTLTYSTRILPFSSGSITTPTGTLTIRHTGTNVFASNNVFRVRFNGGGFNFTRPITLGFVGDLPATQSQLESYNDNTTADQTFSGNISGTGQLRRDAANPAAAGRTILSGANSYSGGTVVAVGTLLVNNPFGSGTGAGFVVVSNTGTLGGSGTISGPVSCAGIISPGQSVSTLTLGGGLDLSTGGTNVWELSALSTTGEGLNFDQIVLTDGNLALSATSILQLSFVGVASVPSAADPFWLTSHTWKVISLTGSATNTGNSRFGSIVNGSFATGSFTNYADTSGNILLVYNAVPAPAPVIQSASVTGASQFVLSHTTETNRTYILQTATNLESPVWIGVSTNIALGNLLTLTNLNEAYPMQFYRVRVLP